VIDHSLSNPVETGFREVLHRQAPGTGAAAQQNAVANPLYRKPNFSGYYENYYTSSESLHQVQKNGVVDIKSSLNVVGGKAVSVGVGISGAYYDAQGSTDGAIKKNSTSRPTSCCPRSSYPSTIRALVQVRNSKRRVREHYLPTRKKAVLPHW